MDCFKNLDAASLHPGYDPVERAEAVVRSSRGVRLRVLCRPYGSVDTSSAPASFASRLSKVYRGRSRERQPARITQSE